LVSVHEDKATPKIIDFGVAKALAQPLTERTLATDESQLLGTSYKLRKFVRRNRVLVGGVTTVMVVLLAGVVVSTIFAIGQARARAERQLVTDFLKQNVLSSAGQIMGREATVIDVLNASIAKLDEGDFRDQPLIEAEIRHTLAYLYYDLGHYAVAAQHQKSVHRIYAEQLGDSHETTNITLNWLAVFYYHAGKYREAEPLYKQVIGKARQHKAGVLVDKMRTWKCNLACAYAGQGRYQEAEKLLRESLENCDWATQYHGVGYGYHLGEIYREQGKYEMAESVLLKTLDTARQRHKKEKQRVIQFSSCMLRCMNELALLYLAQGHHAKAEELFEQGIDFGARWLPGKDHPDTLRNVNDLAILRIKQERYDEADTLLNRALAGRKVKLGDDHPKTLETINDLDILHREQGQYDEAERLLIEAHKKRQTTLGEDHPHALESAHELAVLHKEQGDYDKAEPLLQEAVEGRRLKLGDKHPHTLESWNNLIDLYETWNKPEKAEELRAKLVQTEAVEQ